MAIKPRVFWDTSALIDAIFAYEDSPYFDLFELGATAAVDMRVSPDVLRECHGVLHRFGDETLTLLEIVLAEANFSTTPEPGEGMIHYCMQLTGYRNDALVLAAAEECGADVLLTHDKQHFIGNPLISPPDTQCRAMPAEEALEWCVQSLLA